MYKQIVCGFVLLLTFSAVRSDEFMSQNEVLDYDHDRDPVIYGIRNDSTVYPSAPKDTWLDSARSALTGPAGRIVMTMAKEMIARSTGNSQVKWAANTTNYCARRTQASQIRLAHSQILSLNLTNLLILVLLKALIFAAGLVGAGNWGQYGRARNNDRKFSLSLLSAALESSTWYAIDSNRVTCASVILTRACRGIVFMVDNFGWAQKKPLWLHAVLCIDEQSNVVLNVSADKRSSTPSVRAKICTTTNHCRV